ncbi:hypothetical protein PsYK624_154040 [Phanerochaete sordida]|uniref:Uncharacterized protein n=1 Tax=Phanerochaete sordida TaxID=48140 RepID=A0A9P3GPH6_9APHY|nr:hypothetical protein PsYK624_154040 [Phanerochaete sordida]
MWMPCAGGRFLDIGHSREATPEPRTARRASRHRSCQCTSRTLPYSFNDVAFNFLEPCQTAQHFSSTECTK